MEEKKTQNCPICGTPCEVIDEPYQGDKPVEEIWDSFWKPIVSNEDGTVNIEQVKKELADFSFVMEQVPKVYCHITGDKMSKVMYKAEDVIRVADDHFNEALREAVKEETESVGAVWVKASSPGIKNGEYVAKFKAPGINLKHDFVGMAFIDDRYVNFVCPCHYDIKWAKGHEELQYLTILDESGQSKEAPLTQSRADFIREVNNRDLGGVKESDAVAFHDWAVNNAWEIDHREERTHTTAELYGIFKQKKRNNENG